MILFLGVSFTNTKVVQKEALHRLLSFPALPVNIPHPDSSKSTLSATYLYLAWHRLTMNQHKMSPSRPVDALLVSFHDNVPG